MTCLNPVYAYVSSYYEEGEGFKNRIHFNKLKGQENCDIQLPCGRCLGCMEDYSKSWAVRCMNESKMHDKNSFITLTYNEECLPENRCVSKKEVSSFIKKLRKKVSPTIIRFFGCGEYGGQRNRPHYHLIIFGYDFPDKEVWNVKKSGIVEYRSDFLESIWRKGFSTIEEVNYKAAAYVARYVVKKRKDKDNPSKYELVDSETGEIFELEKEFGLMSRRPGIGAKWFDRYSGDFLKGFLVVDGMKFGIPKYYKNRMKDRRYQDYEKMNERTCDYVRDKFKGVTKERMKGIAKYKEEKFKRFKRNGV